MEGANAKAGNWIQEDLSGDWLRFGEARETFTVGSVSGVLPALYEICEKVEQKQLWAVGWISYEASPAFDGALSTRDCDTDLPLLNFSLFDAPCRCALPMVDAPSPGCLWSPDVSHEGYGAAIESVREAIAAGDTYQVNYTHRLQSDAPRDTFAQFVSMNRAQQGHLGAYIDAGRWVVASASPELFFRLDGKLLSSRPMKGTVARHPDPDQDATAAEWLRASIKNRAENLMIVDMLRNDMGRIARTGTVHVPRLLTVERYPTVWQMTSTVQCETDKPLPEILQALFPCASITGAPKRRTMQIISELESSQRGVYTGAIGFIAPGRSAQFNVAIRTVVTDRERGRAQYGVGGGVVWDSDADEEYAECVSKAKVLSVSPEPFSLFETLLWKPDGGYFLIERHLHRLARSCRYFAIPLDLMEVRRALDAVVEGCESALCVRLLVDAAGCCTAELRDLPAAATGKRRICLASEPVQTDDLFLYHKTTRRDVYDKARRAHPEADDVLLWNERGEITETTIANIVVDIDGERVTPPVSCGLLAGTYRQELLSQGRVRERVIMCEDLARATSITVVNSVRGELVAELLQPVGQS